MNLHCLFISLCFNSEHLKTKLFISLLFLLSATAGYSANKFSTNFGSMDLLVVVILCAALLFINHVLKLAIRALQYSIDEKKGAGNLSEKEEEKINDKIDGIEQAKTVLLYCSMLFIFLYTAYMFVKG